MRDENTVPAQDRVLVLEGRLSAQSFNAIRNGLPADALAECCYFTRYAYADLALPKAFEAVVDYPSRGRVELVSVVVLAATQQFAVADKQIPHGWKMICWLGGAFKDSKLISELPTVSTWFESPIAVGLTFRSSVADAPEA